MDSSSKEKSDSSSSPHRNAYLRKRQRDYERHARRLLDADEEEEKKGSQDLLSASPKRKRDESQPPNTVPREVASQGGKEDPPRDLDSPDKVHLPPVPQRFLIRAPGKRDDDDISSEEDEHASGSGLVDIKLPQKPPAPDSIPLTDMMESDVIPSKKEDHASETKSDEPGSVECLWCEERFDSYKFARKHILLNHGQWEEGFQPQGPDDPIYEDDSFCVENGFFAYFYIDRQREKLQPRGRSFGVPTIRETIHHRRNKKWGEISNPYTPGPPNMTSVNPKTWMSSVYDMYISEEDELHFDNRICFYGLPDHFIPDEYGSDWDEDAEENDKVVPDNDKDVPDSLRVVKIEAKRFLDPSSYFDPPGWVDPRLRMK